MSSLSDLERKETKSTLRLDSDPEGDSALSVGDLMMMLRRHLLFIVACVAICTLAAFIYVKNATFIYEATAILRIDPGRTNSLGLSDLGGGSSSELDTLQTEIAIIQSDAVAIETLHSLSDSEFLEYTGKTKKDFDLIPNSAKFTPAQEAILGRFKANLKAKQVEGTQLVAVAVRDPDPRVAAFLANRTLEAYLQQSIHSRVSSADEVSRRLSDQLDTIRKDAEDSQRRLANFQEKNNILVTDSGAVSGASNTTTDRLRMLNTSLAQAQADRIVKEAQMRATADNPAVLSSLFPNPQLTALQTEQGRLYAQSAQLSAKFGPNYPPLAEINSDLKKVQIQIDANTASTESRIKQEYDAAVATESLLQSQYNEQEEKAFAINRGEADYAVLQAEVSASRELYNTLQHKLQQAGVNAGLAAVNTMLLDTARVPLLPLEPKKQMILGFGMFLGLFVGVGMAFLLEASQDKIQNGEQLERSVSLPLVVVVPHIPSNPTDNAGHKNGTSDATTPVILSHPVSSEAESFRTLRNAVAMSSSGNSKLSVLVVSSLPGEGSTTIAANYAVAVAESGARVLLVDANLRRPGLHKQFGLSAADEGLSNLLEEGPIRKPYLQPVAALPNLSLLPTGKKLAMPSILLCSSRFGELLDSWKTDFDVIVFDSAPLLSVSDTVPLSALADTTILVARYNLSPIKALKQTRSMLTRSNANVIGVILNDAPQKSLEYGGYGLDQE